MAYLIMSLDSLQPYCTSNEVSTLAVFQTAWAFVLRCYLDNPSVCFIYSSSKTRIGVFARLILKLVFLYLMFLNRQVCNVFFGEYGKKASKDFAIPEGGLQSVLLTGATGLLGSRILYKLCLQDNIRRIVLHVRG